MATVRMTDTLRSDITVKLRRSFEPRVKSIVDQSREAFDAEGYAHAVKTALFDSFDVTREVYDTIPEEWGGTRSSFDVGYINEVATHTLPHYQEVAFAEAVKVPRRMSDRYTSVRLNSPLLDGFADHLQEMAALLEQVSEEEKNTLNAARALLAECHSLKQALEAWPAVEGFVPTDVMDRYRTPVERKTAATMPTLELSADLLNASVAKNRMIGATYGN